MPIKFSENATIAHTIIQWLEINGTNIRCHFNFIDLKSEILKNNDNFNSELFGFSAIKYVPLLESAKALLYMSLVDIVNKETARVVDSFKHLFRDHTVVIYSQLLENEKIPSPINLRTLRNTVLRWAFFSW